MRIKLGVLFIVAVIASAGMGVSYAVTNGEVIVNGACCYPDIQFTEVTTWDNEYIKEVADVTAQIVDNNNGIQVFVSNAYPGYIATINFTMKNVGDFPAYVSVFSIEISDDALDVDVVPDITVGTVLDIGDEIKRDLTVHVTEFAEQNIISYRFWVNTTFLMYYGP